MFGPCRRKRIAFLAKLGEAGLGRIKPGLGHSKTKQFPEKHVKLDGTNAYLDRTGVCGSRFLQKTAKYGLGAVKQSRGAANQCILVKRVQKTLQNGMGGSVFGLHRRVRIAFCGKFEDARLGHLKKGLGRSKKTHLRETM